MALTAGQLIALACEAAHSPKKTAQALQLYNSILSDLCQTRDFAEARGQFMFFFQPQGQTGGVGPSPPPPPPPPYVPPVVGGGAGTVVGGGAGTVVGPGGFMSPAAGQQPGAPGTGGLPSYPGNQFGSGPYLMPVDYLRLSGSSGSSGAQRSFIWWLDGVPYPVIPMDLAEFDMQVQQTGLQSFVWLSATDMAAPIDDRILLKTTGDVTAGSTTIANVASTVRLIGGNVLGVAGQGIVPGTTLSTIGTAAGVGTVVGGGAGTVVGGGGGTVVGGGGAGGSGVPGELTISVPANATITGASIFFGYPPLIYIYPPPISALQAMIRYQKQMPDVVDTTRIPWFRNDEYVLDSLIGKLCRLNDDTRADLLLGGPDVTGSAENKFSRYLAMKDDEQSHPKRVELDRRYFGRGIGHLRNTKHVGWMVLTCVWLGGIMGSLIC